LEVYKFCLEVYYPGAWGLKNLILKIRIYFAISREPAGPEKQKTLRSWPLAPHRATRAIFREPALKKNHFSLLSLLSLFDKDCHITLLPREKLRLRRSAPRTWGGVREEIGIILEWSVAGGEQSIPRRSPSGLRPTYPI